MRAKDGNDVVVEPCILQAPTLDLVRQILAVVALSNRVRSKASSCSQHAPKPLLIVDNLRSRKIIVRVAVGDVTVGDCNKHTPQLLSSPTGCAPTDAQHKDTYVVLSLEQDKTGRRVGKECQYWCGCVYVEVKREGVRGGGR